MNTYNYFCTHIYIHLDMFNEIPSYTYVYRQAHIMYTHKLYIFHANYEVTIATRSLWVMQRNINLSISLSLYIYMTNLSLCKCTQF